MTRRRRREPDTLDDALDEIDALDERMKALAERVEALETAVNEDEDDDQAMETKVLKLVELVQRLNGNG